MDAPTVGVLRDVTLLVWLALLIGVAAYRWVRHTRPAMAWNMDGQVDVRSYLHIDAIIVAAISILLLGGLQKASPAATDAAVAMELNAGNMFLSILIQLMVCAALLFYIRAVRDLNPLELFGMRRLGLGQIVAYAVVFMLPTFILIMGTSFGTNAWLRDFWPDLDQQASVEAFRRSSDPVAKSLLVIAAVIVAPIVEETVFRGFIYGVVKRFTDRYFAALCSSLLFAVVHFHIGSLIPLAVLALVFCAAYERTGSLAVPMVMHGLFNGCNIALMIIAPDMTDGNPG